MMVNKDPPYTQNRSSKFPMNVFENIKNKLEQKLTTFMSHLIQNEKAKSKFAVYILERSKV